jgi:dynein heavy chain 1
VLLLFHTYVCGRQATTVELIGKTVRVNQNVGIFVTMNPGYAGRSELPDNLKQLFRPVAMIKPDWQLIAQVLLFSQGFQTAEKLASRAVMLFDLCAQQLSTQPHYDFGLRALKSVLVSAGNIKRQSVTAGEVRGHCVSAAPVLVWGSCAGVLCCAVLCCAVLCCAVLCCAVLCCAVLCCAVVQEPEPELDVLIRSISETVTPKLVASDQAVFQSLISGVFPGCDIKQIGVRACPSSSARVFGLDAVHVTRCWVAC